MEYDINNRKTGTVEFTAILTNNYLKDCKKEDIENILYRNRAQLKRQAVIWALNNKVSLENCDLSEGDYAGIDFEAYNLSGCNLNGCNLDKANFDNSNMSKVRLDACSICNCSFKNTNLSKATMYWAVIRYTKFHGANLYRTRSFEYCTMTNVEFDKAENISQSLIDAFSKDLLYVLMATPENVVELFRDKLINGEINGKESRLGSDYLIETVFVGDIPYKTEEENGDYYNGNEIPFHNGGLSSICEQLLWNIDYGDTPDNNEFALIAMNTIKMAIGTNKIINKSEDIIIEDEVNNNNNTNVRDEDIEKVYKTKREIMYYLLNNGRLENADGSILYYDRIYANPFRFISAFGQKNEEMFNNLSCTSRWVAFTEFDSFKENDEVLVSNDEKENYVKAYFYKVRENGGAICYSDGKTSFSSDRKSEWKYCIKATVNNIERYIALA